MIEILHPTLRKIMSFYPDEKISFRINKNINSLITVTNKKCNSEKRVSIHSIFLAASDEVIKGVAEFIKKPNKENRRIIRRYIAENSGKIDRISKRKKNTEIKTEGKFYNLQPLFEGINIKYFNGTLNHLKITWAQQKSHTRKRISSLNFGSFSYVENLIRIHPVLDSSFVPKYFIEYIIYHEMLHSIISPTVSGSGYMCYHNKIFREKEKEFKNYTKAESWQKNNLKHLLKMVKLPNSFKRASFN